MKTRELQIIGCGLLRHGWGLVGGVALTAMSSRSRSIPALGTDERSRYVQFAGCDTDDHRGHAEGELGFPPRSVVAAAAMRAVSFSSASFYSKDRHENCSGKSSLEKLADHGRQIRSLRHRRNGRSAGAFP